jgi:2-C-methyl-D-erythritol 4-phosphate cytidylyltransferase
VTVSAVIVAGGTGERFGSAAGKQMAAVAGAPVLAWSLLAFEACADIDEIVLVGHPERLEEYLTCAAEAHGCEKVTAVVAGGETRQDSVLAGLGAVCEHARIVAVHDGARPLVLPETISAAITALREGAELAGVAVGHPMHDTVKRVFDGGIVVETVDRSRLWAVQTPQLFRVDLLRDAYAAAADAGFIGTDDASFVEAAGGKVRMLAGPGENIKVTMPEDLAFVEAVLEARARRAR